MVIVLKRSRPDDDNSVSKHNAYLGRLAFHGYDRCCLSGCQPCHATHPKCWYERACRLSCYWIWMVWEWLRTWPVYNNHTCMHGNRWTRLAARAHSVVIGVGIGFLVEVSHVRVNIDPKTSLYELLSKFSRSTVSRVCSFIPFLPFYYAYIVLSLPALRTRLSHFSPLHTRNSQISTHA